jgi:DNA modification methylase
VAEEVGFNFHNLLAWRKNTCTANRWYMKEMELICFFYKKPAKAIINMSSKQIFEFDNPTNKKHPTEKPYQLVEHYILNSSLEGELVLDPFGGSGTTAIAAINTNRKWVCIEKDETYYSKAIKRISDHVVTA